MGRMFEEGGRARVVYQLKWHCHEATAETFTVCPAAALKLDDFCPILF